MAFVYHGRDDKEPRVKLTKRQLQAKVEHWAAKGWGARNITSMLRDVGEVQPDGRRKLYRVDLRDVEVIVSEYRRAHKLDDVYWS